MCETLAELRQAAGALVARLDLALVAPGQLGRVVGDAGAIEKMMATLASLAAARMAGAGPRSTAGRQAARDLAHATGTSLNDATRALEASKQLGSQPDVAAAARAGQLSRPQLALVSDAVATNPGAADRLLELARTGSLQELADESARARVANEDLEARRKAVHAARSLRQFTDGTGTWQMHAKGTPEDGAKIMAAVRPFAEAAFEQARKQARREAPEAYGYDGLVALATAGGAQSPRTDMIVRADHAAIVRGYPIDGEVCEIAGFGPVSPQVVLDIMGTGDPFLKALVTKGKDVVSVAHLGRRPNAHQQTALDWLFPTCAAEGCGTRAGWLQTDHREDWARTHVTVLDLLDRLCRFHHGLKTHQGWRLVDGRGKRAFVAPDDPRHPRHRGTHGRPGSAYSEDSDPARPGEPAEPTTAPPEPTTGPPEPTTGPAEPTEPRLPPNPDRGGP
jgi:hypothetical protein